MSKLIGTNPNQVPSNADLGTAAFMDKKEFLLSKGSEMSAIDAVIPKSATGVLIYDTTKDSDGGAWRKRTQHTSWYNERLNTTTRGSRKEFPTVAVIVCINENLTIYDGDDATLPMWMVFNGGSTASLETVLRFGDIGGAVALNATLFVRLKNHYGATALNFISEKALTYRDNGVHEFTEKQGLVDRNVLNSEPTNHGAPTLRHETVNDLAITVLPNSPIDSATGLPIPTIALALGVGVSVIRDDETIVDLAWSTDVFKHVRFTQDSKLIASGTGWYGIGYIPKVDTDFNTGWTGKTGVRNFAAYGGNSADLMLVGSATISAVSNGKDRGIATTGGLTLLSENETPANGMVAYVTSDYNTGWMNGDIKLATLSDTDTTNAVGAELVTNGTFASDTGWTKGTGWTISGGGAVASSVASGVKITSTAFTVTAGYYTMALDVTTSASTYFFGVQGATSEHTGVKSTQGTVSITRYLNAGSHTAFIGAWSSGLSGTFDNFSVRKAERDHSAEVQGLQVFGTIVKTPVRSGAELVAYNASNTTSYLEQTYNSDLDFGTAGDFHYSFWVYSDSSATYNSNTYIFERTSVGDPSSRRIEARMQTSTNLQVYATSAVFVTGATAIVIAKDRWNKVDIIRKSNVGSVWVNAVQQVSGSHSGNMTDTSAKLTVCNRGYFSPHNQGFPSGIALFRVSGTAPSAEQIAKMYNDEKHLFRENAKATLYGTSDAVTALAHDDDTDTLHAGTSAGRSDFQGLRRINNTTRAIATAISAVDGFIVEE